VSADDIEARVTHASGDQSVAFLKRNLLVSDDGVAFRDFRRQLTPRFGVVWSQIALGYVALVLVGAVVVWSAALLPGWMRIAGGALLIGFFQAFIQLFFHEAAHFNLAPGRERNDRLANLFVGAIHGLEIRNYRVVHFEHHRRLGETMDTERSYFDPLNVRFFAEALLGIKGLRVLRRRESVVQHDAPAAPAAPEGTALAARRQRMAAAVIHTTIVVAAFVAGQYALAAAWSIGTLSVMPLFVSLRQLLEHRSESADPHVDYTVTPHGAVNRLFGDGPLASTLGGAGFNRHLLHHWEPQISYTRLRELEAYILRTDAATELRRRQSTYLETFWALVSW